MQSAIEGAGRRRREAMSLLRSFLGRAAGNAAVPADPAARSVEGRLVYAIGDVHGCYDEMTALLGKIVVDARVRANGRRPVLIFCGDYIDRGPESAAVLDALCWLRRRGPYELHLLKGNHEEVFTACLRDPKRMAEWCKFGGIETLRSYGVAPPAPDDPADAWVQAHEQLLQAVPLAHWGLLENLKTMLTIGDYAFVHAGIRPGVPLDQQVEADLLWIRKAFLDHSGNCGKVIVHGHNWCSASPDLAEHRIGIDTGAYQTGVLTAVRLEDGRIDFLHSC